MEFKSVSNVLGGSGKVYAIPNYQRDYAWQNKENDVLLDDILATMGNSSGKHFLGAVVLTPYEADSRGEADSFDYSSYGDLSNSSESLYHVVDGQQRLTSVSLLLCALRDVMKEDRDCFTDDNTFDNQMTRIKSCLRRDSYYSENEGKAIRVLNLLGNTGVVYENRILDGITTGGDARKTGAGRVTKAYNRFKERIEEERDKYVADGQNKDTFYKRFIQATLENNRFVEIICDSSMDAFDVFDSLNGKGMDLTVADRIKNLFMSWVPDNTGTDKWEQLQSAVTSSEENDKHYLSQFFSALFFYHNGEAISKNMIPSAFKSQYADKARSDFSGFFDSLLKDTELYGFIRTNKTVVNHVLHDVLDDFSVFSLDQIWILIFAICKAYPEDTIEVLKNHQPRQDDVKPFKEFLEALLKLTARMHVCQVNPNNWTTWNKEFINQIKEGKTNLNKLMEQVIVKKNTVCSDIKFQSDFEKFAPAANRMGEFFLRHIEYDLRIDSGNQNRMPKAHEVQVEHIMPQKIDLEEWYDDEQEINRIQDEFSDAFKETIIESIGNKALLLKAENISASNSSYPDKVQVYKAGAQTSQGESIPYQTFEVIKELVDEYPDAFTDQNVLERAKKMAERAIRIW